MPDRTTLVGDLLLMTKDTFSIHTGFTDLDFKTGGLNKGQLTVLGGRPNTGKTVFAISCISNMIDTGNYRIAYFSLADRADVFIRKMLLSYAKVNIDSRDYDDNDKDRIKKATKTISDSKIEIYDSYSEPRNIKSIITSCHDYAGTYEGIDIVIIDSLELIDTKAKEKKSTEKILKELKKLAIRYDCCVLLLSNLKGGVDTRRDHIPRLTDFKYKRSIETYANQIWALYYEDTYKKTLKEHNNKTQLHILKGNDGYIEMIMMKGYGRLLPMPAPKAKTED